MIEGLWIGEWRSSVTNIANHAFEHWAERIRLRLDRARGVK